LRSWNQSNAQSRRASGRGTFLSRRDCLGAFRDAVGTTNRPRRQPRGRRRPCLGPPAASRETFGEKSTHGVVDAPSDPSGSPPRRGLPEHLGDQSDSPPFIELGSPGRQGHDGQASDAEVGPLLAVALESRPRGVPVPAVELDAEVEVPPEEVDLLPVDVLVCLETLDPALAEKTKKPALTAGAGALRASLDVEDLTQKSSAGAGPCCDRSEEKPRIQWSTPQTFVAPPLCAATIRALRPSASAPNPRVPPLG
jgi:hypothetical protein